MTPALKWATIWTKFNVRLIVRDKVTRQCPQTTTVWRWGKREIIYLSLHCRRQNDSCVKMGSNKSHFNVSLIVRNKVIRRCPQTSTFSKRKESRNGIEPRSFFLPAYNALPLGQTGSLIKSLGVSVYRPQRLHMACNVAVGPNPF